MLELVFACVQIWDALCLGMPTREKFRLSLLDSMLPDYMNPPLTSANVYKIIPILWIFLSRRKVSFLVDKQGR